MNMKLFVLVCMLCCISAARAGYEVNTPPPSADGLGCGVSSLSRDPKRELHFLLRGYSREYWLVRQEVYPAEAQAYCCKHFKGRLLLVIGKNERAKGGFVRSLTAYMGSLGVKDFMTSAWIGDKTTGIQIDRKVDITMVSPRDIQAKYCIEADFKVNWLIGKLCIFKKNFICEKPDQDGDKGAV